jgi:molybdate-binding protein
MKACADGIAVANTGGRTSIQLVRQRADVQQNLILMGCATGLGLLADRLSLCTGAGRYLWLGSSSTAALKALSKQQIHVAGVHLVDARTSDFNLADVRKHAGTEPLVLITLARWEVGLVTSHGNPLGLKRGADLARRGLRVVRREQGAGARRLLDRELRNAGITLDLESGHHLQASGHLEVAQSIALGAADVGIATRDVAIAYDLAFVPLSEERYDLVLPQATLAEASIQRLLDMMTTASFRSELTSLGYDVSPCGDRVAEVNAA